MQRNDKWPEDYDPDAPGSRPASRRNSASSRRNSVKEKKKSPTTSSHSTPKKVPKPQQQQVDLVVMGKQILRRCDRANSLPGSSHRRSSVESFQSAKVKRTFESQKRSSPKPTNASSAKSRETSLEDDMSLDLSQVSDFEDTNSKYGIPKKFTALAASTPKNPKPFQKRSGSLQSQLCRVEPSRRTQKSFDSSKQSTFSYSRDSLYKTSSAASPQRYGHGVSTELDYSSVSPEYSGQSSAEASPSRRHTDMAATPRSQEIPLSSCCVSTWAECSEGDTKKEDRTTDSTGEWNNFWANYNNSVAKVPMKSYYDQCPTPYRTENIELLDFDFSTDGSKKRSPENLKYINNIIRNEGLHLTPRETQNIIKCAHILGNVLSKAIDRRTKEKDATQDKIQELDKDIEAVDIPEYKVRIQDINIDKDPEIEVKKKTMSLNLKETNEPLEVKEEKTSETVMTQTDISLPNTKSAPRIFESILRQLSRTSLDKPKIKENKQEAGNKEEGAVIENDQSKHENNEK